MQKCVWMQKEVNIMFNKKEYVKKWQKENFEYLKSYRKKYYEQHKDYYREYSRSHYTKTELSCKVCGKGIEIGKFCDKCALDKTKVSRQVVWLRRKKLEDKKCQSK